MSLFANHMLITTVAMVRVTQAGMKTQAKDVDVLATMVPPRANRATPQVKTAKPIITSVNSNSLFGEDLYEIPCIPDWL